MNVVINRFLAQVRKDPDGLALATESRRITRHELELQVAVVTRDLINQPREVPVVAVVRDAVEVAIASLAATSVARPLSIIGTGAIGEAAALHAAALNATVIEVATTIDESLTDGYAASSDPSGLGSALQARPLGMADVVLLGTTSGSTGRPKPVMRTAESLFDDVSTPHSGPAEGFLLAPYRPAKIDDVHFRAFFVGGGTARAILRALLVGVPVICPDPRAMPASRLFTMLAAEGVTTARIVPSVLRRAVAAAPSGLTLGSLHTLMTGGEPLHWSDIAALRRLMVPGSAVVHTYGSTETGAIARYVIPFEMKLGEGVVPVGSSAPGRTVTIVDDAGCPVVDGEIGRVSVEGRLGAVDARFERLPDGRQRYVTSDLGHIDEFGCLRLVGRTDGVVKIGAVRIDPSEIEGVLRDAPHVQDVAVITEGVAPRISLVAHVVIEQKPHSDLSPDSIVAEMRVFAARQLTSAAMPNRFVIHRDSLPLLSSGKVDRSRLAAGT